MTRVAQEPPKGRTSTTRTRLRGGGTPPGSGSWSRCARARAGSATAAEVLRTFLELVSAVWVSACRPSLFAWKGVHKSSQESQIDWRCPVFRVVLDPAQHYIFSLLPC